MSPRQAGSRSTQRVDAFTTALRWLLILQGILVAPLVVWADPIVALLFGHEYSDSVLVLQLLVPYVLLRGVSPLIADTVVYVGKAARRIPIVAFALVVNVVIDLALLPVIGISAAAIGTSVAYCMYVPANLSICRQQLGFSLAPLALTLGRTLAAAAAMGGALPHRGNELADARVGVARAGRRRGRLRCRDAGDPGDLASGARCCMAPLRHRA